MVFKNKLTTSICGYYRFSLRLCFVGWGLWGVPIPRLECLPSVGPRPREGPRQARGERGAAS